MGGNGHVVVVMRASAFLLHDIAMAASGHQLRDEAGVKRLGDYNLHVQFATPERKSALTRQFVVSDNTPRFPDTFGSKMRLFF